MYFLPPPKPFVFLLLCFFFIGNTSLWAQKKSKRSKRSMVHQERSTAVDTSRIKHCMDSYDFEEARRLLQQTQSTEQLTNNITDTLSLLYQQACIGEHMLQGVQKVSIVDSVLLPKHRFLEAYRLSPIMGRIGKLSTLISNAPATLQEQIGFLTALGDQLLVPALDSAQHNRLATALVHQGEVKNLSWLGSLGSANRNDAFPFLSADGQTLYFSSKSRESLGGLDIFMTRYHKDTQQYLPAENIGMPFNSPSNDYALVIDETLGIGWFTSDRHHRQDSVCVYTFIPQTQRNIYAADSLSSAQLKAMAQLHSIQQAAPHPEELAAMNAIQQQYTTTASSKSFRWIVNDTLVYHSLNDFRSNEAKEKAEIWQERKKQWLHLCAQLESLRQSYPQRPDQQQEILQKEVAIEALHTELGELAKAIRQIELTSEFQ